MVQYSRVAVLLLIASIVLSVACSTNSNYLRNKDDIDDIHQQLYELRKEQLKNSIRIEELQNALNQSERSVGKKVSTKKEEPVAVINNNMIVRTVPSDLPEKQKKILSEDVTSSKVITATELYNRGYELFNGSDFNKAIIVFREYAEKYPHTDLTDNAYYWIGECWYSLKEYQEAVKSFDRVIRNFPEGNKLAASYLKKGLCYLKLNMSRTALSLFQNIKEKFPGSDAARVAEIKIRELTK